ncbi:MAG: hypothetical protein PHD56_12840 [Anaerostipes sp.]|nr:hypothetical protein [Eubacteriales bacterium]MDD4371941.1 hypothetical protein [Anaerostipes sp.]
MYAMAMGCDIIVVLILPLAFGVEGPLFSAPIADVVTFLVMIIMVKSVMKELNVSAKKDEV